MKKRKTNLFLMIGFLLLVSAWNMSGCAKSKEEPQADTESVNRKLKREMTEPESSELPETESPEVPETENDIDKQEEKEFPDDIFYWGAEEYFYLLEGEWVAAEYAGTITETGFDEVWEEWYQEEMQKYDDEVIEKYLGSEYRVEMDNLLSFAPYADLCFILEDDGELFSVTRFIPGKFITITPPYIALSARLADKDEEYWFIIDADGTVLIEIEYHFFRLERKEGQDSAVVKGEDDTMEMTPENQANYDEFVAIMYEIWEEIGEGRRIEEIEYEENAEKIPLAELLERQ